MRRRTFPDAKILPVPSVSVPAVKETMVKLDAVAW